MGRWAWLGEAMNKLINTCVAKNQAFHLLSRKMGASLQAGSRGSFIFLLLFVFFFFCFFLLTLTFGPLLKLHDITKSTVEIGIFVYGPQSGPQPSLMVCAMKITMRPWAFRGPHPRIHRRCFREIVSRRIQRSTKKPLLLSQPSIGHNHNHLVHQPRSPASPTTITCFTNHNHLLH